MTAVEPVTSTLLPCTELMATAPVVTVKLVLLNDATPLLVSVASSAEIVTVLSVMAVSMPSPPVNVNV